MTVQIAEKLIYYSTTGIAAIKVTIHQ